MEPYETQLGLATALGVGLLIGLEREQTKPDRNGRELAGIRTYPIVALLGALSTMLGAAAAWLPLIMLLGVIVLVAISYTHDVKRDADHGMTTEVSLLATFLLGALAESRYVVEPMADRFILVAAIGVVITLLLSSKQRFHAFVARVSRDDLFATLKFLIVAVIVVPLLPDRDFGPLGAINPRHLGLMVVLIAGLSFGGYVAMLLLGARRGILLGAALGGLVSSTAVTLSYATRTRDEPELAPVAAGGIAVAWAIMLGRVAVVVALIDPRLLATLAIPLGAMVAASLAAVLITFRRADAEPRELALKNPFELGSALKVSLAFGVVLLATKAAIVYLGARGLYAASALAGTTDVDAVTLSTARLSHGGLDRTVAAIAIVIAIAANTIVKTGLARFAGTPALGRRVAAVAGLTIAAGALGLVAELL